MSSSKPRPAGGPPPLNVVDDETGYSAAADGDEVARGLALGGHLRVLAVRATGVAQALKLAQDPGPVGAVALSRSAVAALLLGATLKDRQQVALQINGNGPLGEVYALADAHGNVRATVAEPRAQLAVPASGPIGLAKGLGLGRFQVIKKLEEDAPPYNGVVPLVHGEIAPDLAEYFFQSEQIPTAVVLGEELGPDGFLGAGGYLLQAMPGAPDDALAQVESAINALPPLGRLFAEGETPEGLLRRLLPDVQLMGTSPVRFAVPGGRPKFARMLMAMGSIELARLKDELNVVDVECHFTGRTYSFNQEELSALVYGARTEEQRLGIVGRPPSVHVIDPTDETVTVPETGSGGGDEPLN